MHVLDEYQNYALRNMWGRERRDWEAAWHQAAQKLPVDELPLASIRASEWGGWTERGPEGSLAWQGVVLLTNERFVKISSQGISQIRLRELDGAGYREFRYGFLKAECWLLLTAYSRVIHAFRLSERPGISRQYGEIVDRAMNGLPPEKFA